MFDFKAAIFDLDGTLLDSMGIWEIIDIDFLSKRNLPVSAAYINKISSLSFKEAAQYTINFYHLEEKVDDIISEWNTMAAYEYGHNIRLKPYAKEYLTCLKSYGIRLGTATSLPKALSEPVLKNNNIFGLFDVLCGADEVSRGKEFPDVFLFASERLQVPPDQCIVFEDLLPGIISAKKAGMKVFGIYDKYSIEHRGEIKEIADGYLHDFKNAPIPSVFPR